MRIYINNIITIVHNSDFNPFFGFWSFKVKTPVSPSLFHLIIISQHFFSFLMAIFRHFIAMQTRHEAPKQNQIIHNTIQTDKWKYAKKLSANEFFFGYFNSRRLNWSASCCSAWVGGGGVLLVVFHMAEGPAKQLFKSQCNDKKNSDYTDKYVCT